MSKLHSNVGFTLTEMLATVIILGLATACLAGAITLASSQFTRSVARSQAQELYSSLQQTMDTGLRYTKCYYGEASSLDGYLDDKRANKEERYVFLKTLNDDGELNDSCAAPGELVLCTDDNEPKSKRLIGKGSYNCGLKASVTRFEYDTSSHYFTVTLVITRDGEAEPLVSQTFTVDALNNPTQES